MIATVIGFWIVLTACGDSPTEVPTEVAPFSTEGSTVLDGLLYHVTTAGHDSVLTMEVDVTNQTDSVVVLVYGACMLYPLLYLTPQRMGVPAYDFQLQPYPGPEDPAAQLWACPLYGVEMPVQPGESWQAEEFRWAGPVRMIFGDSLGPMHYYFTARLDINRRYIRVDAGDAVVSWP